MPTENLSLRTSPASGGSGEPSRRDFLKITGTGVGLMLICSAAGPLIPPVAAQHGGPTPPFARDVNAYVHVEANGRITGYVGKVEIGSGQRTALAQCIAEELDVAFNSIDMVLGDTDLCPWDYGTVGSQTFNVFQGYFRTALAEGRAMLVQMAADKLEAPVEQLQVENGVVSLIGAPSKSISYARLVDGKRIERHIEIKASSKTPAQFKVIGTSVPRVDALDVVTAKAKYVADMGMPGTLYARVVRPDAYEAKLMSLDTSAAENVGVKVVRDGDFIALLGEQPDLVDRALNLVKAEWKREQDGLDHNNIFAHLPKFESKLTLHVEKGSMAAGEKLVSAALRENDGMVERSYTTAYAYHAQMETHTNVARFENGKLTLWASTQSPFAIKKAVAEALKLEAKNVRVIAGPYVCGGFGCKGENALNNVEAARIATLVPGKTVQVVWSRAEDIMYNRHRPAAVVNIRAGLTSEGKVGLWECKVFGAGEWASETRYDFPNQRISWAGHWSNSKPNPPGMQPIGVGPWRGPAATSNTFAKETMMDELAVLAGVDPAEFRLRHLEGDKRLARVFQAALDQFGYQPGKSPSGRGIGISCAHLYNTYTCSVAQVEVNKQTGAIKVLRVVNAVDCGVIVNPLGATMQMESAIIFGMGTALFDEVRFKEGKFEQTNFDGCEIPRFSNLPKMEVVLVKSELQQPLGLGEPPVCSVAPAIANAVHDALGVRIRHLPMTPERVMAALQGASQ